MAELTKEYFLKKAEENFPKIYYTEIRPESVNGSLKTGDSILLDLGNHYVGKFSFSFDNEDDFISAPVHFTIRFGEDMRDINDDYTEYHGTLAKSWLQEESFLIDYPMTVDMPRRYACRYIRITVTETRKPIILSDFCFTASTSADISKLKNADITDERLRKLDDVSVNTLKNCMQTFMEDGPKRDRRMWIGDLRLEALVDYCTFDNLEIIRRGLYLFAAGDCNELGFLPSYIYETPYFFSGRANIADYALLYVVTVCDYYKHTGDSDTLYDLLDLCKSQLSSFRRILGENGVVKKQDGWFSFIDWCPGLEALTSLQGVYLYTLDKFVSLLDSINDTDKALYEAELANLRKLALKHLFDENVRAFVNETDNNQLSVHSQVWMILGGVISGDEGRYALEYAMNSSEAKKPLTPYMHHYLVEAMLKLGMTDKAMEYVDYIWGGMLDMGADTYYEAYAPGDPDFSPYADRKVNSLCHAWSSTPAYFIRNYFTK